MKIASYLLGGRPAYGVVTDGGLITVSKGLGSKYASLRAVLEADALEEIRAAADGQAADAKVEDVQFLPVITDPTKILCVGLNYEAHRIEAGRDKTEFPTIFVRFPTSQVGHNQPMIRTKVSDQYDYEGELAIVIGKHGRYLSEDDALSIVAGYTCFNDGSIRDWQRHTIQFTPGKNFPNSGACGPWMTTADEIPDPQDLVLETRLNGEVVQHTNTDDMTYPVREIISYCSTFTDLMPGDVIPTGTPSGVGLARTPQLWMKPGDVVEVDISKIGILRNPIEAEA
jgi:2-keto-4-pentenoate hydratase/2-oxohepta-3-ene-1,7-dioic acid hydratase in catechol pathway